MPGQRAVGAARECRRHHQRVMPPPPASAVVQLRVTKVMTDAAIAKRAGTYIDASTVRLVPGSFEAYAPDGSFVVGVYRNAITPATSRGLEAGLGRAAMSSTLRGQAAGPLRASDLPRGATRLTPWSYSDGSAYKRSKSVRSGAVGYRRGKPTYWTKTHPQELAALLPFLRRVSAALKRLRPAEYAAQLEAARGSMTLDGTVFSTLAVNRNFRTGVHIDGRDYPGSVGCMVVLGDDSFTGGELLFPQYGLGVDVRVGDIIIFDSFAYHCNGAITANGDARLTVVLYLHTSAKGGAAAKGATKKTAAPPAVTPPSR